MANHAITDSENPASPWQYWRCRGALALVLAGVCACDAPEQHLPSSPEAAPAQITAAPQPAPEPERETAIGLAPEPAAEPVATRVTSSDEALAPVAADAQPAVDTVILNLDYRPSEAERQSYQQQEEGSKALLPDMFGAGKQQRKVSLSGGILRDPENEELLDSVNGAELSLEVKTR
jgi:hypothetical protein